MFKVFLIVYIPYYLIIVATRRRHLHQNLHYDYDEEFDNLKRIQVQVQVVGSRRAIDRVPLDCPSLGGGTRITAGLNQGS